LVNESKQIHKKKSVWKLLHTVIIKFYCDNSYHF